MATLSTGETSIQCIAHLISLRNLTNQSMIPASGIMERRHQRHVSSLRRLFPPPQDTARLALLADISGSYWTPFFALFPHCEAWSQASWIVLAIFWTNRPVFCKRNASASQGDILLFSKRLACKVHFRQITLPSFTRKGQNFTRRTVCLNYHSFNIYAGTSTTSVFS